MEIPDSSFIFVQNHIAAGLSDQAPRGPLATVGRQTRLYQSFADRFPFSSRPNNLLADSFLEDDFQEFVCFLSWFSPGFILANLAPDI